ncbi:hypothetical protein QBZ16_000059 [Prototheca wickerhamii]|uniref:Uncharacterized protein n=1 Tax=Prototheca wickerhamii TaxID=3111 RepID=A0AAD9MP29_PROWI|nr:hypothetical protein QBZ16_000059 [Prototheca wickerhamii]
MAAPSPAAQALTEQLAQLHLVQSLSSLHQQQQNLAAAQAAASLDAGRWEGAPMGPPALSDPLASLDDYNAALAVLQQQAAAVTALGRVGPVPDALRSSAPAPDLGSFADSRSLSLDARRFSAHADFSPLAPLHSLSSDRGSSSGSAPRDVLSAYNSSFFSPVPEQSVRGGDLEQYPASRAAIGRPSRDVGGPR